MDGGRLSHTHLMTVDCMAVPIRWYGVQPYYRVCVYVHAIVSVSKYIIVHSTYYHLRLVFIPSLGFFNQAIMSTSKYIHTTSAVFFQAIVSVSNLKHIVYNSVSSYYRVQTKVNKPSSTMVC